MRGMVSSVMLCLLLAGPLPALGASWLDSVLFTADKDPVLHGTIKSVDAKAGVFVLAVEGKGEVAFRVSPQTEYIDAALGGLLAKKDNAALGALKPGSRANVRYLTLPQEKPVAVQVELPKP